VSDSETREGELTVILILALEEQNHPNGSEILVEQAADLSPASDLDEKLSHPFSETPRLRGSTASN
jgi:hypothetical protein